MEVKELLEKAENGDLTAVETVAESYFRGQNGFVEDNEKALVWYQKALNIDPNSAIALNGLGSIYYNGYGVPVDIKKGLFYSTKAADLGYAKSATRLGDHYLRNNDPRCITWYERAFECGEASAAFQLFSIFRDGIVAENNTDKQREWLKKGAEAGDVDCQLAYACEFLPGGMCEQDYSLALKWMLSAAENGSGTAMNNLAIMYTKGEGVEKNYDIGQEWAIKAAQHGDAGQLRRYAAYYQDGDGFLPHSPEKANELFRIGADAGDSDCMLLLGRNYLQGRGIAADIEEAIHLFEKAGRQGNKIGLDTLKAIGPQFYGEDAPTKYYEVVKDGADDGYYQCMVQAYKCLASGDGVEKNEAEALVYLEKAANDKYKEALFYLGNLYLDGKIVQEPNLQKAAELFETIVSQGDSDAITAAAQRNLAFMYKDGAGVSEDKNKAISLLEDAANNGNIDALIKAGLAHDDGGWANLNYDKAVSYYTQLADVDNTVGITCLGVMYEKGHGVEQNYSKAVELYEKAANLGDSRAMTNLALLYQDGKGVEQNPEMTTKLLISAADKGYDAAQVLLGANYYLGQGVTQDFQKALQYWEAAANQGNTAVNVFLRQAYTSEDCKQYVNPKVAIEFLMPYAQQGDGEAAVYIAQYDEDINAWDDARKWYSVAAEAGNAEAQFHLAAHAFLLEQYDEAARWVKPAAEQGHLGAMTIMADMLFYGDGFDKDEEKAFQYYLNAADHGNIRSMYLAGRCLLFGRGTSKDGSKAFHYLKEAADCGSDEMWVELGNCYRDGIGVTKDVAEAINCYQSGIRKTNCNYCRSALGELYADKNSSYFNQELAEEYLIPLTQNQQFKADAAFRLGVMYGNIGDMQDSVHWYMVASDENHAVAQYNLGVIFFNGELGNRDLDNAERYFLLAANNGYEGAEKDAADCRAMRARIAEQSQQTTQFVNQPNNSAPQKSGGCYIATAVYGSYDCPEVWTLRRFRDYTLAQSHLGRSFIKLYYTISPTLVRFFGNSGWFRRFWKGILDKFVGRLNQSGYESGPYQD